MIEWSLKVFGLTVVSVTRTVYEVEEVDAGEIGAGSTHNFDRDFYPLSPTSHHEWEWEDRQTFGFGGAL